MALKGKHGAMLAGRYRLLEQLGEGGMGSVWKAEHLVLRSQVAIKIIDPDAARFEFNLARFLREAKTLASLRSPHVVQVLDFGSEAETPYLVMELLEGQTLGSRLTKQRRLTLRETSEVLQDVCAAMALVHDQGLIHRDLKPDNIFLCESGERRITKIVDFGIAKSMRPDLVASMKTRTGHMLGTPSYMSPEQCRGLKDIDHRADLWALGVIAYECLVGKVPFEGEVLGDLLLRICMDPLPVPSRQVSGLPDAFDSWFARAVARDREQRFQSAQELARSLAELSPVVSGSSASASREPLRRSEPVRSAPLAAPAPPAFFRQTPNTETNTSVGLGAIAALKGDGRTWGLVLGALALAAALGVWGLGDASDGAAGTNVGVQSLRPHFEATPKELRKSVPSGRRWQPAAPGAAPKPDEGGAGAVEPARHPAPLADDTAPPPSPGSSSSAPPASPVEGAPAEGAPAEALPAGNPGTPAPSRVEPRSSLAGSGAFTSVAPGEARSMPTAEGRAATAPEPAAPEPAAPEPAAPEPAGSAPAGAEPTAPRALRGTAAPGAPERVSNGGAGAR